MNALGVVALAVALVAAGVVIATQLPKPTVTVPGGTNPDGSPKAPVQVHLQEVTVSGRLEVTTHVSDFEEASLQDLNVKWHTSRVISLSFGSLCGWGQTGSVTVTGTLVNAADDTRSPDPVQTSLGTFENQCWGTQSRVFAVKFKDVWPGTYVLKLNAQESEDGERRIIDEATLGPYTIDEHHSPP